MLWIILILELLTEGSEDNNSSQVRISPITEKEMINYWSIEMIVITFNDLKDNLLACQFLKNIKARTFNYIKEIEVAI
jgi:hypothetical protein